MKIKANKTMVISLTILAVVVIAGFFYCNPSRVDLSLYNDAEVVFWYGDENIKEKVSAEDAKILKDILHEKKELYWDNPSCGFNDFVSVRFGNNVFSPACDNCNTIRYRNKYLYLSDKEMRQVRRIMRKHGAHFPCV